MTVKVLIFVGVSLPVDFSWHSGAQIRVTAHSNDLNGKVESKTEVFLVCYVLLYRQGTINVYAVGFVNALSAHEFFT